MMIWQLLQVRKLYDKPLIMVEEMWSDLTSWAEKHMVNSEFQLASPVDMTIPRCVNDCSEAMALLRASHQVWEKGDES
ncbi:MAG: hypothetical protein WA919_26605 [Coleofasciculaceae cyanobacterium]